MPHLAYVLLEKPEDPPWEAVRRELRGPFWRPSSSARNMVRDGDSIAFAYEGGHAAVMLVEESLPPDLMETVAETSLHWPEGREIVPRHKAFLVCRFRQERGLDAIEEALVLGRVVSAVLSGTRALGVSWNNRVVSPPGYFRKTTAGASRKDLPTMLWVNVHGTTGDRGTRMCTAGLSDYDLMEIEADMDLLDRSSLVCLVADFARYLLHSGPVVEDGHTTGSAGTDQRILVRHESSIFIEGATVYRLRKP